MTEIVCQEQRTFYRSIANDVRATLQENSKLETINVRSRKREGQNSNAQKFINQSDGKDTWCDLYVYHAKPYPRHSSKQF